MPGLAKSDLSIPVSGVEPDLNSLLYYMAHIPCGIVCDGTAKNDAGIYCVPCECGKVYVGQTGRTWT
jgi:hypothetical protein